MKILANIYGGHNYVFIDLSITHDISYNTTDKMLYISYLDKLESEVITIPASSVQDKTARFTSLYLYIH